MVETQPADGSNPAWNAAVVRGVDPETEGTVTVLPNKIIAGKFDLDGHGLVVGIKFAELLGLAIGDHVAIHSPHSLLEMKNSGGKVATLPDDYTIRGVFDVGHNDYNSSIIITSLENAQDLYVLSNEVHGLMVMLRDSDQVDSVRDELLAKLGPGYHITTWTEENSEFFNALMVEKRVMFLILFVIIVVAAFGITSTLITFVYQKTREIGILKALGATNLQIAWLFLSQSVLIGVLGVTLGYVFARVLLAWRNEFLHFMDRLLHQNLFSSTLYLFDQLPARIVSSDVTVICGCTMVLCVLGGVIPALRAARLHPVEALRHE